MENEPKKKIEVRNGRDHEINIFSTTTVSQRRPQITKL